MGEIRNAYKIVRKPEGERPLKNLGVDGRILLEWILGKQGGKVWTGHIWLRIRASGRLLSTR
jgi:hypothetical protein